MHEVEIKQRSITPMGTEVYLDGKKITGIREIAYDIGIDRAGSFTFEIIPERCNIHEEIADVELCISVDSLYNAIRCMQYEMMLNPEFRKGMVASAASVLIEYGMGDIAWEMGKAIIERVFDVYGNMDN